ncbi:MAG: sugar phosphate nucleotidyltransferase [candidate division Zixibacteria bacterium]|nr:sugar phosphate nucleotidyltransferase [candidate division Zixibacteria bacterium]
MKVIIPVAGEGTRLRPHTLYVPKSLLAVGGKPMLAHILTPIETLNPDEVIFVVGHLGQMIVEYVKEHYSFKPRFVPQTRLLGLGYAIYLALKDIDDNSPVLIILGDTIIDCNNHKFIDAGDNVLGVKSVNDPHRFGIAELDDGWIVGVEEKPTNPKSNLALIGAYYFKQSAPLKKALEKIVYGGATTNGEIQLTDALQIMIRDGVKFRPYQIDNWYDCGERETLLGSNQYLLTKLPPPVPIDGSVLTPPLYISPSAQISKSIVGPYVSISEGAIIENSIVTNSIIGEHSHISDAILEESITGFNAVVKGNKKRVDIGDWSEIDDQ